jgi:hypothetical protein
MRISWAADLARLGEKRNEYTLLLGKPEGKRTLGKPRHTWDYNTKMDLVERDLGDVDYNCLHEICKI